MNSSATIYVAGGRTLIGSALLRRLAAKGYTHVVTDEDDLPTLTDVRCVDALFARIAPQYVFVTAGKSGGIEANQKYPADLMRDNLLVVSHVLDAAYRHGVTKLLYLASSCSYPRTCPTPMRVESLLTGPLEKTNEPYAVAKIAGITLCRAYRQQYATNFISGIPADVFGPGDDFSAENSHVLAALVRRMHEAKLRGDETVEVWGTGAPRREFIYSDDLADACIFVMDRYEADAPVNLGGGTELSIKELATLIKEVVEYRGQLCFEASKPDGMPAKMLDWSVLRAMGWRPSVLLRDALRRTYDGFLRAEGRKGTVYER